MRPKFVLFVFILANLAQIFAQKPCAQRTFRGPDNLMVCVCNATYCDEFPPLGQLQTGQAAIYTSSQGGNRFSRTNQDFTTAEVVTAIQLSLDTSTTFQKIIGFGGAFSDAASLNLFNLSKNSVQNLVNSYFAPQGIGYTTGRVPMAGCDFSTHEYSYDDVDGDFNLTNFALANEDLNYKIPFIKMATALTPNLKLFSSPWAAPGWMKTDGTMHGNGSLKGDVGGPYYQTWANYFVRFFEEYNKQGVNFWGLTVQNEPDIGPRPYEEMFFTAEMERDFLKMNLGPALKANSLTQNIKIMIMDTNRPAMPNFPGTILADPDVAKYVDGIGIHWYSDNSNQGLANASNLQETHFQHSDKFMLYTEACAGWNGVQGTSLGDWTRADQYAHNIMEDLFNWVTGWTDWNMCLNLGGGPNWVGNFVDSPIIVNATADEFYKNPMYYALGHFSKFITENSTRVQLNTQGITNTVYIEAVAFLTPTNQRVLVINNRDVTKSYPITIKDPNSTDKILLITVDPRSIQTIVWNPIK